MTTATATPPEPRRRQALRAAGLLVGCGALWAACATEEPAAAPDAPPALDVALVVDPNVTSEADLAARLASLVVIVDAPDGLYEPGEEATDGGVQVKNADADPGDLELVATLEVSSERLPTFRLERGGLPDVAIDLRVIGFTQEGSPIAEGSLRAARFGDAPEEVQLPFGLRASELPPRVVDALPADGSAVVGCSLPSLVVVFSRPVDAASLQEPGAVTIEPAGSTALTLTAAQLDPSGLVATLAADGITGGESLDLRLTVSSTVRAAGGGAELDQVPAEDGLQPFVADVHFVCTPPPATPCMEPGDPGCPEPCGALLCPDDPRIQCFDDRCVLHGCATACAGEEVCDEARGSCVVDCRTAGAIDGCDPDVACDGATGLCGS